MRERQHAWTPKAAPDSMRSSHVDDALAALTSPNGGVFAGSSDCEGCSRWPRSTSSTGERGQRSSSETRRSLVRHALFLPTSEIAFSGHASTRRRLDYATLELRSIATDATVCSPRAGLILK
jgi:hypothetical protein